MIDAKGCQRIQSPCGHEAKKLQKVFESWMLVERVERRQRGFVIQIPDLIPFIHPVRCTVEFLIHHLHKPAQHSFMLFQVQISKRTGRMMPPVNMTGSVDKEFRSHAQLKKYPPIEAQNFRRKGQGYLIQ